MKFICHSSIVGHRELLLEQSLPGNFIQKMGSRDRVVACCKSALLSGGGLIVKFLYNVSIGLILNSAVIDFFTPSYSPCIEEYGYWLELVA